MRRPQPYFKKSHHAWYVNLNGKTTRLASEAEGEEAAYIQYDKLMAGRQPIAEGGPVEGLFERFLEYHKSKSAEATYQFYRHALDSFAHYIVSANKSPVLHAVVGWMPGQDSSMGIWRTRRWRRP